MNLIICLTPLQMLIAEAIIKKKQLKNNILVVIAYNDNDKFRYYYNRLGSLCDESYFFLIDNSSLFNRIKAMARLKLFVLSLGKYDFSSCHLASIDCSYIQLITSGIKYKELYTFDDGTINLLEDSPYYKDKQYSFLEKLFRTGFGIKDSASSYRRKSILHYTIFKDNSNIIDHTEFISFVQSNVIQSSNVDKVIKIFVGQPLSEIKVDKNTVISFLKSEKIDYYYPHPRDKVFFDNVEYIYSNRIFEDYLIGYLEYNVSVEVNVYTFFSTVVMNIKDLNRVNVISLFSSQVPDSFIGVYELFRESNIEIRTIDE